VTSYRDLNTAKFTILQEVEKRLPLSLYSAEWNLMGRGQVPGLYRPLSHIERVVPWIFVALYVYVLVRPLVTSIDHCARRLPPLAATSLADASRNQRRRNRTPER